MNREGLIPFPSKEAKRNPRKESNVPRFV